MINICLGWQRTSPGVDWHWPEARDVNSDKTGQEFKICHLTRRTETHTHNKTEIIWNNEIFSLTFDLNFFKSYLLAVTRRNNATLADAGNTCVIISTTADNFHFLWNTMAHWATERLMFNTYLVGRVTYSLCPHSVQLTYQFHKIKQVPWSQEDLFVCF